MDPYPGLKAYYINYLINSGGMFASLLFTLAHVRSSTSSVYNDENLLETIHQVKVWR